MPSTFYAYFKENMDALNLPCPEALFSTIQVAMANAQVILTQIDKFGKAVTIGEIIGAGTKLEVLGAISGLSAAGYVGAVVGSIAVATGRTLAGGASIADVLFEAHQHNLHRQWLTPLFQRHPGIYDRKTPPAQRKAYRYQAVLA